MSETLASADFATYVDSWNAARDARELQRRDPYGYVSYAAFHKLETAPQCFAGIPGVWTTGPNGPAVDLADSEELTVNGEIVVGSHAFAPLREREFRRAAYVGEVVIELSKRGGQDLLRPIDPAFGRRVLADYDHTPAYEPEPRWIVEAEFFPFESLRPTPLDATIGEIVHIHPAVGEVVFEIAGVEQRLVVFARDDQQAGTGGTGFTTFTDATGGVTTDPAGRSIDIDFPSAAGPVTLDFNSTRNLQRPYTAFAPCPLPPEGNHLTVAIEAGDQLPVFRR
jgi:uncharacterized protein (DUF1684 family)